MTLTDAELIAIYQENITMANQINERLTAENAALHEQLRWIPVSERKPTVDDCRIDSVGRRVPYVIGMCNGHLHGLIHLDYFAKNEVYTHWMSFPELPEVPE